MHGPDMRILSVVGTRPEAIKMAMVARALASADGVEHFICVTAQHRQLLDSVLKVFDLHSDFDLDVMKPDQDLTHITNSVLAGMATVLRHLGPDRVLVQGDTTTAFGAALAAFYSKTPVGHVEAGLRSGTVSMPWPEEMNRRLTDSLSDRHYVPTTQARDNLLIEGIPEEGITITGNTVIDALLHVVEKLRLEPSLAGEAASVIPNRDSGRRLILVTGHRRENFGSGILQLCEALIRISARDDVDIVYPVHPNPNVTDPVHESLGARPNIHLIPPLDYVAFVYLMTEAHVIITDSGGIQEEAPSLGKPVLVTRDVTERPEAVDAGTVKLVGTNSKLLVEEVTTLLDNATAYSAMARVHHPYGDGHASKRIMSDVING